MRAYLNMVQSPSPLRPEQIYYRIHGDSHEKPPLVLLHGLMGFAANWGKVWPEFAKDRQVLVLDQRGHGRSAKPEHGYTPDHYAADVLMLINQLGWKKIHLLGHSMGGRVAMHFAASHPDKLQSLVVEDSGAEARPDRIGWINNILGNAPTPFSNRESAKKYFDSAYSSDPITGSFLHANMATNDKGELDWRFHAQGMVETIESGRAIDAMSVFCALRTPTLILRGGKSIEFTQEEAEHMKNCRPDSSELAVIEGAGHLIHAEKPKEFSQTVRAFLEKFD